MSAAVWVGVGLLGGLGAVVRVVLTQAISSDPARGTMAVNLGGALALGVLVGAGLDGDALLLGGGLLGALTTFSTLVGQAASRCSPALLAGALALGFGAAATGRMIGMAL